MQTLSSMAVPLLGIIGVSMFLVVIYLLWSADQSKKATAGKLKAYILMENKILWKGLCDYSDTKVRAPWNKSEGKNKDGDRVQVFEVEGDQIWYDRHPEKGWFSQTVPCAFFHERNVCAIFPPEPCNCGHAECAGRKVPELTPSQLGLIEDEHVTEATMKATLWVKEMFDKVGEMMTKMLPNWVVPVGFLIMLIGLIVLGFLVYQAKGDIGWIRSYLAPAKEAPLP